MKDKTANSDRVIFYLSVLTSLFFLFLYINNVYLKLNFVIIGVLQELFSILFLVTQPILLVFACKVYIKNAFKIKSDSFITILILIPSIGLTWMSFFTS